MTYLRPHNRFGSRQTRLVFTAGFVLIILVIGIELLAPRFFIGLFNSIARPFWRMEFSIESGSLKSAEVLLNENEELKRKLSAEEVKSQSISVIESQNAELLRILGRSDIAAVTSATSSFTNASSSFLTPKTTQSPLFTLAAVLARPPFLPYDELIIDAGADKGFSTTSLVYAPGNILIGRVADVMSQTSKVILFSSPGEKYQVLIGEKHDPATAIGRGGGQYEAELPRDIEVANGDFVLTPAISDRPFGIVTAVVNDPAMPFEKIFFAPPVNIFQLRWVMISKGKN